ncbi:MAG TPA: hypothetical protein VNN80_12100 [Polyangiaceae bacterium]|nr:hypothetical protein [Polyangiaceae bacterium]
MGRPSTGPAPRSAAASGGVVEVNGAAEAELAPDISSWPGTAEAAKIVGRHTSTIKLWRAQNRVRAIQDASGCWRYHPDDLAESVDVPDATDPGSVLASGMSAIVSQGAAASDRLIAMTELSTSGLEQACVVLSKQLETAYARIAELEKERVSLLEKLVSTHAEDLKHERYMRRLDQKHELGIASGRETSERLAGLITIIGPIAASIGQRWLGLDAVADKTEAAAIAGVASPASSPAGDDRLSFEAKVTAAMGRLCVAIRSLAPEAYEGLRAMLPPNIAQAVMDIRLGESDATVGQALSLVVKSAQALSDLQFLAIRPIAPADVVVVLDELRTLFRNAEVKPE